MQRAVLHQATFSDFQKQATRLVPGHGTGLENRAVNDDSFRDEPCQPENSLFMQVMSVLANVVGGTLVLGGMFFLPHLIARILT